MRYEVVPANRLEPIGAVREAGIRNDDNHGGDSNVADLETEIYQLTFWKRFYKAGRYVLRI